MADPSGAPPQPGPNDVSTAILRPKKSYVNHLNFLCVARFHICSRPNRLIVDEASADDNSGLHRQNSMSILTLTRHSRNVEPRHNGDSIPLSRRHNYCQVMPQGLCCRVHLTVLVGGRSDVIRSSSV